MSLPHRECTAGAAAPQLGVVDDVVVHQRRGVDELDHRRVEHRAVALVAARAAPPSAARPAGCACRRWSGCTGRSSGSARPATGRGGRTPIDLLEVGANRLENLRQGQGRFLHSGSVRSGQSDHKLPRVSTTARACNSCGDECFAAACRRARLRPARRSRCATSAVEIRSSSGPPAPPARRHGAPASASTTLRRHAPARCACRDAAPAPETGCRSRSAADRAARSGRSPAAHVALGNVTIPATDM